MMRSILLPSNLIYINSESLLYSFVVIKLHDFETPLKLVVVIFSVTTSLPSTFKHYIWMLFIFTRSHTIRSILVLFSGIYKVCVDKENAFSTHKIFFKIKFLLFPAFKYEHLWTLFYFPYSHLYKLFFAVNEFI